MKRGELYDELARAMEPKAWAEYDEGHGVCTNQAGWKCLESLEQAIRAITFLEKKGYLNGV